jgi:hypothetical protein
VKRFFTAEEMSRVCDMEERPDLQRAVGEDSEMVEGGYIADLAVRYIGMAARS